MATLSQSAQGALLTIFYVAGPILGAILAIGVIIGVFLAMTQINEPTVSFVPKFFGAGLVSGGPRPMAAASARRLYCRDLDGAATDVAMTNQPAQAAVVLGIHALRRHLPSLAGPSAFVLVLAMVVVPLPPFALDLLFTFNICFALMILLASLYTAKATDFSAFPTLLLLTTLLRLSLNVAAARVILLDGYLGSAAAGRVIEVFRRLCRRRQLCGRHRRLRDPRHHQFRRDYQRRRAHCRSRGTLRARRHARQADGDRRRSQCRPDQPGGSDAPAPGGFARSGFFWRDGRCQQIRARRCGRGGNDTVYQPGRRFCHWHHGSTA